MFAHFVVFVTLLHCVLSVDRVYYIAIKEEIWDYAPTGRNLITGVNLTADQDASVFYSNGADRIGRKYKKAIYRQYEDDTYAVEIKKDPTLGFLGPTLIAEVGDTITVYAKNLASRNYSLHPHGARYTKPNEGAYYVDNTPAKDKFIKPGASKKYKWHMDVQYGPTEDDPACVTWIYHSHVEAMRDTYSGLVGGILLCRKGSLNSNGRRTDVDRSYFLMFFVVDENLSWYIDDNINDFCTDPSSIDKTDGDFIESNNMHGINGLGYGNLQGLEACQGESLAWNIFGIGNEVDIHSVHFERQTVITSRHRQDTVRVFAAIFRSIQMAADNPGTSLIACKVNDHFTAGMLTKFNVNSLCGQDVDAGATNPVKKIFIGVEERDWNYGPSGMNLITGSSLIANGTDSQTFFQQGPDRIGGTYTKAMFFGYADETFNEALGKNETYGILGPLIAVEVGDVIEVTLKNMANRSYNVEPHGLYFNDTTAVDPNSTHTFTWRAPDSVSPTSTDPDCITYLYTSAVDPVKDPMSGLVGPMMLCKRGKLADALARQAYFLLFAVMDENLSHYLQENVQKFTSDASHVDLEDAGFQESNLMHGISGLLYGNLQGVELCADEETDFHVIGLGTEVDMHSMFVEGVNIRVRNENTAVVSVFPHTTSSATVIPDQTGSGQIKCVVTDHLVGGMITSYSVKDCGGGPASATKGGTLTYYIAAVEENWDYAPENRVDILGRSLDDPDTPGYTYAHEIAGSRIGSVYKKALYHQYTDETFTKKIPKPSNLGMLGPVISAEEGDTIVIVFKNMASRSYSITPWGAKDITDLFNSITGGVSAGESNTYKWRVPTSAVPPANQPGCTSWFYKSNVDEIKDVFSGLIGPLLLCRKGSRGSNGGTAGINKEFYLLFAVVDENQSHYIKDNIRNFADADPSTFDAEDEGFQESNLMHGINGVIYGLSGLVTDYNDEVIWHLIGYGNEVDIHTVHFHAHAYTYISDVTNNGDVFELFPGKIGTVQMKTTNLGIWLMHCHVDDHLEAGMITTYTVQEAAEASGDLPDWAIGVIAAAACVVILIGGGLAYCIYRKRKPKYSATSTVEI